MIYLFAVCFVLWSVTFGCVLSLGARQKRLQQELEILRENGPE